MEAITRTIVLDNGEAVAFARLTVKDLFSISDDINVEREQIARQLSKEEGIDKFEVMNLVLEIRSRKPTIQDIIATTSSPQGANRILLKSLAKIKHPKPQEVIDNLSLSDVLVTARMLALDDQEVKQPKKDEGQKESPLPDTQSTSSESVSAATPKSEGETGSKEAK